jgi:hypothetical protein
LASGEILVTDLAWHDQITEWVPLTALGFEAPAPPQSPALPPALPRTLPIPPRPPPIPLLPVVVVGPPPVASPPPQWPALLVERLNGMRPIPAQYAPALIWLLVLGPFNLRYKRFRPRRWSTDKELGARTVETGTATRRLPGPVAFFCAFYSSP